MEIQKNVSYNIVKFPIISESHVNLNKKITDIKDNNSSVKYSRFIIGLDGVAQRLPMIAIVLGYGLDGGAERQSPALGHGLVAGVALDGAALEARLARGWQVALMVARDVVRADEAEGGQGHPEGRHRPAHAPLVLSVCGKNIYFLRFLVLFRFRNSEKIRKKLSRLFPVLFFSFWILVPDRSEPFRNFNPGIVLNYVYLM